MMTYIPLTVRVAVTYCRGTQNQGLLHLSQSANTCKTVLKDHLELARRVVHLSELSRRLETIQEQVRGLELLLYYIILFKLLKI